MPPRGYWFAIVLVTSTAYLTTSVHAFQRARSGISMPWESRRCNKLQCRASGFVQSLESQRLSGLVLVSLCHFAYSLFVSRVTVSCFLGCRLRCRVRRRSEWLSGPRSGAYMGGRRGVAAPRATQILSEQRLGQTGARGR